MKNTSLLQWIAACNIVIVMMSGDLLASADHKILSAAIFVASLLIAISLIKEINKEKKI